MFKLFIVILRKLLKNKWKSFIFLLVVFSTLAFRVYFIKQQIDHEVQKDEENKCVKAVVKHLTNKPTLEILDSKFNLDWQLSNNVSKYVYKTGLLKNHSVYLTIGIPSIKRIINSTYLLKTLEFLTLRTTNEQKANITCVIFLSDLDDNYNKLVENQIKNSFPEYLNSGFFHILRVNKSFYPPLNGLKRNFNDAEDRIRWRAKQVSDYILLFRYCSDISEYHIQIEDDVESADNFFTHIKNFIDSQAFKSKLLLLKQLANKNQHFSLLGNFTTIFSSKFQYSLYARDWSILDFSVLGFIGKLLRSTDLKKLASFLATFYDEQPVDWLIVYWIKNIGQIQSIIYKPSLFQHFGLKSSFNFRQDNKLRDKYFYNQPIKNFHENPLAVIYSNMTSSNKEQIIENVYIPNNLFTFQLANQNYSALSINFIKPENVDNISISSGPAIHDNNNNNYNHGNLRHNNQHHNNNNKENINCLQNVSVYAGKTSGERLKISKDNVTSCIDLKFIGHFSGCLIDAKISEKNSECIVVGVQGIPNPIVINNIIINSKS